jgi:DNA anti-recombination protein RmuC
MAARVLCPDCEQQEGIVPCLGCKQTFCTKHFQVHRQKLSFELKKIVDQQNILQESYQNTLVQTCDPTTFDAWTTIDQWEEDIHAQVRQAADNARQQLGDHADRSRQRLEQEWNLMTEHLQQRIETDNYLEQDIEKIGHRFDRTISSKHTCGFQVDRLECIDSS